MKRILLIIAVFFFQAASAKGVYQTPEAFLNHAFNGNIPPLSSVWLTKEKKQAITDILQHNPSFIRVKY